MVYNQTKWIDIEPSKHITITKLLIIGTVLYQQINCFKFIIVRLTMF